MLLKKEAINETLICTRQAVAQNENTLKQLDIDIQSKQDKIAKLQKKEKDLQTACLQHQRIYNQLVSRKNTLESTRKQQAIERAQQGQQSNNEVMKEDLKQQLFQ